MPTKKVCANCKHFVEGNACPACKGNKFTNNFHGRIHFIDVNRSFIAKQMSVEIKGEYALKVW